MGQEDVLVVEAEGAVKGDDHSRHKPDRAAAPNNPALDPQGRQIDQRVLECLDDRDGHALAGLAGIGHPEPGVGQVASSLVHELRTEQPTHGPGDDEDRRTRSRATARRSCGHQRLAQKIPVGTPPRSPPKLDSPPCQIAKMSPGFSR